MRDAAPRASFVSNVNSKCQKCLQSGHWTADCPNKPVYKSRPSRTALLKNPQLQPQVVDPVESVEERMEKERRQVLQQVLYQKVEEGEEEDDETEKSFKVEKVNDSYKVEKRNSCEDGEITASKIQKLSSSLSSSSSDTDFSTDEELLMGKK